MTARTARRERLLYEEQYRRPGLKLRADCLPTLRHTTFVVEEAYIRTAGKIDRGGELLEYQDLRIYLREPR